jgi:hypothetical protein
MDQAALWMLECINAKESDESFRNFRSLADSDISFQKEYNKLRDEHSIQFTEEHDRAFVYFFAYYKAYALDDKKKLFAVYPSFIVPIDFILEGYNRLR